MVGMLGLEPRNPEGADLQSAAVAAVPHPHSVFSHPQGAFSPASGESFTTMQPPCQRSTPDPGVSITTSCTHPQVRTIVWWREKDIEAAASCHGLERIFWSRQRESNPQPTVYKSGLKACASVDRLRRLSLILHALLPRTAPLPAFSPRESAGTAIDLYCFPFRAYYYSELIF